MANSSSDNLSVLQAVFNYLPNTALAVIAAAVFYILTALLFFRLFSRRDWWGLCLPIGTAAYATGFVMRIPVRNNPNSLGLFIAMQLLLITFPATFLAYNYIIYGRLVRNRLEDRFSLIKPRIIARIFIISDITTFLIQGAGGGISSGNNVKADRLGEKIILIGLVAQIVSYLIFVTTLIYTHFLLEREGKAHPGYSSRLVIYMLYFSSIFILVRGVYRVIEFAQGNLGFLITHEVYFYALDTLPLFLATVIWAPFWPGKYVQPNTYQESTVELQQAPHRQTHQQSRQQYEYGR